MKAHKFVIILACFTLVFSDWDRYPTYDAYVDFIEKFESDYPGLCRIVEFGQSVEGRKLLCAKVTDNVDSNEAEPHFLYSSTIHGDEPAGFVLMLRLIDYLLSNYGKDVLVTKLVDSVEIWINPLFNPDGCYWHTSHPQEPAKHTNANDVDLDRNFPNPLGGPHPDGHEWQPETRAMMALADSVSFVMSANFHGGTELVAYPFSTWTTSTHPHVDIEWSELVCNKYVDTVHAYSPPGYMDNLGGGVYNSGNWYIVYGDRMDYMNYFAYCREVKIELSNQKLLPESQLPDHWEYNYRSFLDYIEQALYGIRGTIKDSITNVPLEAKIFIENHDEDSSWVFSDLPHGDFYRPINAGTYDVTFSCDGYYSKTITGVKVNNNEATILNVKLRKIQTDIISEVNNLKNLSINNWESVKKIEIYNLMGKKVKILPVNGVFSWKEGNGIYIVKLVGKDFNKRFKVIFTR